MSGLNAQINLANKKQSVLNTLKPQGQQIELSMFALDWRGVRRLEKQH